MHYVWGFFTGGGGGRIMAIYGFFLSLGRTIINCFANHNGAAPMIMTEASFVFSTILRKLVFICNIFIKHIFIHVIFCYSLLSHI